VEGNAEKMSQDSPRLTRLIACSAVPEGCAVQVEIEGRAPLAVYRLEDGYYVTDDTCSHGEASLADGEVLANGEVECPFHGGSFDIRTGEARKYPCTVSIAVYPVSIVDGEVWAELEPARHLENNKE
jgi:nitrite reductase/ring-hydroxylating ferredoxin subunit